jgi:hypothetical protein
MEPLSRTGSRASQAAGSLVVAGLFVPKAVEGLYVGMGRALPDAYPLLAQLFLAVSLTAWFWLYSRRWRVWWAMDMGWFVMSAWILVLPYYILKREGRSGLARLGLFCLVWFAAWATGWAVQIWTEVVGWEE